MPQTIRTMPPTALQDMIVVKNMREVIQPIE